jgi:hypothetical protein
VAIPGLHSYQCMLCGASFILFLLVLKTCLEDQAKALNAVVSLRG